MPTLSDLTQSYAPRFRPTLADIPYEVLLADAQRAAMEEQVATAAQLERAGGPDPFSAAAARVRGGVRPEGGRKEGATTKVLDNLALNNPVASIAKAAYRGVTLPGDVWVGRVDPGSDEAIGRAADLAGVMVGGAPVAGVEGAALGSGPIKGLKDRFNWSPYNPLDNAETYKRLALEERNKGGGGSTVRVYNTEEGLKRARGETVPKKGSFDRDLALTKAQWDIDKSAALADFQQASNPFMSAADRAFVEERGLGNILGSGATDKRTAGVVAGLSGLKPPQESTWNLVRKEIDNLGSPALDRQFGTVVDAVSSGTPFDQAIAKHGSPELARMLGGEMPAAQAAPLRDRVVDAYQSVTGGKWNERASLDQLRARLPDVPREALDAELKRMHLDQPGAQLMGHDNPREITKAVQDAAVSFSGEPQHMLYITRDPRTKSPK